MGMMAAHRAFMGLEDFSASFEGASGGREGQIDSFPAVQRMWGGWGELGMEGRKREDRLFDPSRSGSEQRHELWGIASNLPPISPSW